MNPLVLAHGFFGFAEMAGLEYFRNIKGYLQKKIPDLKVFITEVAPNDLVKDRAQQLWDQIEKIGEKVHIIGHSLGGLDSRYLISPQGLNKSERVISLTTISSPHWGSPVADFIIDKCEKFGSQDIDKIIYKLPSHKRKPKKIIKALQERSEVWRYLTELFNFSTKAMTNLTIYFLKEFNQKYPDSPDVKYFSYSGVAGPGEKDYIPPVMFITWAIVFLDDDERAGGRNDGLTAVNSAKWGEFKGEIPADHFKEIGYDLSGVGWLRKIFPCIKPFNHLKFFEKVVNDLKEVEKKIQN